MCVLQSANILLRGSHQSWINLYFALSSDMNSKSWVKCHTFSNANVQEGELIISMLRNLRKILKISAKYLSNSVSFSGSSASAGGNVRDQVQPLSSVVRLTQTSLCLLATTSRCRQRESRVMAPLPLCLSLLSHCSSINKQRREKIAFMSKRQRLMLQVLESYNVDWPLPHSPNLDRLLICCKHDELKLS